MKRLFLSLILLTCCCWGARAQGSQVTHEWQFDAPVVNKKVEGWEAINYASPNTSDGILHLTAVTNMGYPDLEFKIPSGYVLDPDVSKQIVIKVKNGTSSRRSRFYWVKGGVQYRHDFLTSIYDTEFHEYVIDLSKDSRWSGKLESIRFEIPMPVPSNSHNTIVSVDYIKLLTAPDAPAPMHSRLPAPFGVNLSGGEFSNTDYQYPHSAELDYFKAKGLNLIRLPFLWERIQPELNGPLAEKDLNELRNIIWEARTRGMWVLLDMHNFGRRPVNGTNTVIGNEGLSVADAADVWTKLADEFKDYGNIYAYGLMHKPHGMTSHTPWVNIAQGMISGIRTVDTHTPIMVAGDAFSSTINWAATNDNLRTLVDPSDNLMFEAHVYFDNDNSGNYTKNFVDEKATESTGVNRLRPFVEWLQMHNLRGFVGEYSIPAGDERWLPVLENAMQYMKENNINGTYYAAGSRWGTKNIAVHPNSDGTDRPQMQVIGKFQYADAPAPQAPATPTGLQATAMGSFKVNLSWNAVEGAITYTVKRATSEDGTYEVIAQDLTETSFTDEDLAPETAYFYMVSGTNPVGEGTNSAKVTATTAAFTIPAAVTGVTAEISDNLVTLNWTAIPDVTTYHIKRSLVTGGEYEVIGTSTSTTYADAIVADGTTYYYVISAENTLGEGSNSLEVAVTPSTDKVAYWDFDETSGSVAIDNWNGIEATLGSEASFVAGRYKNALNLTGNAESYATLPDGIVSELNDFTISAWVRPTANTNWGRLFDFGSSTSYMYLVPRNGTDGRVRYSIRNGAPASQAINCAVTLSINTWAHIAVTLSGNVGILYINGKEVGRNSNMTIKPSDLGITPNNYIGKSQFASDPNFKGQVDEFRIFSTALSPEEIEELTNPVFTQTITFASLDQKQVGDPDFVLSATASSGLPVTFTSSNPEVAVIVDGMVQIVGGGTTTITALQEGGTNYAPAASVSHELTVLKNAQEIAFAALENKQVGDANFALAATASSELPVSYTSSDPEVVVIVDGMVQIIGGGTTTITAIQVGNNIFDAATPVSQELTVLKNAQTITFAALEAKLVGDAAFALAATASSDLPVTYTSSNPAVATVADGMVQLVGAGTTTITATQEGNSLFDPAVAVTQELTVLKANQTITFAALAARQMGDEAFALAATASSDLPVSYTSSNPAVATIADGMVQLIGAGTTTITATQEGNNAYGPAEAVSQELTVTKRTQTITFAALEEKQVGDAAFSLAATASSGMLVNYSSSNTEVATIENGVVTIVANGTTLITATQAGDNVYDAATSVTQELVVIASPLAVLADKGNKVGIETYPNPSRGNLNLLVHTPQNGKIYIQVYNAVGTLVYITEGHKNDMFQRELKLTGLAAGVYYIKANVGTFSQSKSFILE